MRPTFHVLLLFSVIALVPACQQADQAQAQRRDKSEEASPTVPMQVKQETGDSQMPDPFDVVNKIPLSNFDPEGEPSIRVLANGNLQVVFNFMPPSFASDPADLGRYAKFDKELSQAIGLPVAWEDRESFYIENPKPDTVERIQKFVANYHSKQ